MMISSLRIGNVRVDLENTTLNQAQHRLGGTVGSQGDAGNYEAWLCFRGTDKNGAWGLWLTSGEIDGPAIGGFEWRRLQSGEELDRRCKVLSNSHQPKLPLGLSLDMPESAVRGILGKPTLRMKQTLIYFHEHNETIHQLPYTADNIVTIILRAGRVLAIDASLTISD
ncbi:MAG TPA: hypothetical protein VG844_06240 [Terracidiphilus sp.]|jgi:hypothetical protein|nr:hypothetical protein [Terracidiphilus sp.]